MATVSASGAHDTVEPLATGVSTRLVWPSSWQGSDWSTEAAGGVGLEAAVGAGRLLEAWELSGGATTAKV